MEPKLDQWVACYGNPSDGFLYVGMFTNPGDATRWCEENIYTDYWWVINIQTLQDFEEENRA